MWWRGKGEPGCPLGGRGPAAGRASGRPLAESGFGGQKTRAGSRKPAAHLRLWPWGRAWGRVLFTPYTHCGPANPWRASARVMPAEGQSALTVLLRRQSERGGSGAAAAVSLRADGVGRAGLCGRRCLARGARLDPSCTAGFRRARRPRLRGRELAPSGPGSA
jgi:hypothetical protein